MGEKENPKGPRTSMQQRLLAGLAAFGILGLLNTIHVSPHDRSKEQPNTKTDYSKSDVCLGEEEKHACAGLTIFFTGCTSTTVREFTRTSTNQYRLLPQEWVHISCRYEIQGNHDKKENRGIFGAALRAYDHHTHQWVVLKIVPPGKGDSTHSLGKELKNLEYLEAHGADSQQVPKLLGNGDYVGHKYLVFQALSIQVHKILEPDQCKYGVKVWWIKLFAKRLLTTLAWAHDIGISHNDMYYHNILFGNYSDNNINPDSIYLIDFGRSSLTEEWGKRDPGKVPFYAPELSLGIPEWGPPSDMWSFGQLMLFLHSSLFVFVPGFKKEWQARLIRIAKVLGENMPMDLIAKSPKKHEILNPLNQEQIGKGFLISKLEYKGICAFLGERCNPTNQDTKDLVAFSKKFLQWDTAVRMTAKQALEDPFITSAPAPKVAFHMCDPEDEKVDPYCVCNPKPPQPWQWKSSTTKSYHAHRLFQWVD